MLIREPIETALEMAHFGGECGPLQERRAQHNQWESFISKQVSNYQSSAQHHELLRFLA